MAVSAGKTRFSVTLPKAMDDRLEQLRRSHRPPLSKQWLVEYAITRLIDGVESRQIELPLGIESRDP